MRDPKTILITGASSGIGAALARAYAGAGITLFLIARNPARLEEVAAECRTRGAIVHTHAIDVRDKQHMHSAITQMDAQCEIDLVIANAGISTGSFAGNETLAAAEHVFDVNLGGVIHTIHPIIPRMVARGCGQLAIMSSLAGICALPGAPAYSASKAAVRYYGEALHGTLKQHNIHVSVICPGWISTPLTDKNDFPMPFIWPVERAASMILHRLRKKKTRIAFPLRLYIPLVLLSVFPRFVQMHTLAKMPKKRLKT